MPQAIFEQIDVLPPGLKPGSIEDLQRIADLELPQIVTLEELQAFLLEQSIVESLLAVVTLNRTSPPSDKTKNFSADTRFMEDYNGRFMRGVVFDRPNEPEARMLAIHGQPWSKDSRGFYYTYDLSIPLNGRGSLDLDRPPEATLACKHSEQRDEVMTYRPFAYQEYGEGDPSVLLFALQEAARDWAVLPAKE